MSRWLDRRSLLQFALLWGAWTMASCLVGIAAAALWHGGHVNADPVIGGFVFSVVTTIGAAWRRQRRKVRA